MNDVADMLANLHRLTKEKTSLRREVDILPHHKVQLIIHGYNYNRDLAQQLQQHVHGNEAKTYILEKMKIDKGP